MTGWEHLSTSHTPCSLPSVQASQRLPFLTRPELWGFLLKEILAAAQVVFTQVVSEGWGKRSMHLEGKHSAYFFAREKNILLRPLHWIIPEDPSYQLVETAPPRAVCSTVYAARSVCRVQSEIASKPLPADSRGHRVAPPVAVAVSRRVSWWMMIPHV